MDPGVRQLSDRAKKGGSTLRTLVVAPYGVTGGAEAWLLRLLDATDRLEVHVVMLGDGPLRGALEARGIPTRSVPTGRSPFPILRTGIRLARILRTERPDVVLANGIKAALAAVPGCRLLGVPLVWAKHDYSFDESRLVPLLAGRVDRVIAATAHVGLATRRDDVVVVPPPRADRRPDGREEARRFWTERGLDLGDGPVLVAPSRLMPYKGLDDAIKALARPDGATWRLVILGIDDPAAPGERQRLRALADRLGLGDRVTILDPVPDVAHRLAAFDALAVLTRDDEGGFRREAAGTTALEAMEAGVPVIATGGSEVATRLDGGAGVVVEPNDPPSVARALATLTDPALRERMGRTGRAWMAHHPDAETCADLLAATLAEAAARPGAGRHAGPPVSVITTVLDEGPALDDLLGALSGQLRPDDEIVVVDGGSRDDTAARAHRWAERDERIRVTVEPGAGISRGRNLGVETATHDILAFTDAGCAPDPGWLHGLRAPFAEPQPPDLVTGLYRVRGGSPLADAMAVADYPDPAEARRRTPLVRIYGLLLGRVFDPSMPTGRSMACTREAWRRVGGFREDLATAEDVSFGRTLKQGGGRCILQSDAVVEWGQRPTLGRTVRMYVGYGTGDARSGDPRLSARNAVRAAVYAAAPALLVAGGRAGRLTVAAGAVAYLSLPVARALRRPRPAAVVPLVPVALAIKDLAKVAGWLSGLAGRRT